MLFVCLCRRQKRRFSDNDFFLDYQWLHFVCFVRHRHLLREELPEKNRPRVISGDDKVAENAAHELVYSGTKLDLFPNHIFIRALSTQLWLVSHSSFKYSECLWGWLITVKQSEQDEPYRTFSDFVLILLLFVGYHGFASTCAMIYFTKPVRDKMFPCLMKAPQTTPARLSYLSSTITYLSVFLQSCFWKQFKSDYPFHMISNNAFRTFFVAQKLKNLVSCQVHKVLWNSFILFWIAVLVVCNAKYKLQ